MKYPELSVVIPAFNEEKNIIELWNRLLPVLEKNTESFEVIFVDDGSEDNTAKKVRELHQQDQRVGLLKLSRNFGHQIALMAGMDQARGKAIVALDADLQHPPEIIPELISNWRAGAHVVQTIRRDLKRIGFFKRFTSKIFYRLIHRLTKVQIIPGAADFFLIDRSVADVLCQCRETSRFTRGLLAWVGFPRDIVHYDCGERYSGSSKYTLKRMLRLALDAIFAFSVTPLRLAGFIGLLATMFALFYLIYVIVVRLLGTDVEPGWASLVALVTFFGGVQLVTLWVIGEYLARIAEEVRKRPSYIIEDSVLHS